MVQDDRSTRTAPVQPVWLTGFKLVGVSVSSLLLLMLVVRVTAATLAGSPLWLLPPAAVLGYLGADLLSGLAHWFCDTFFDERTPLIGRTVICPFRDHHTHPCRITQYRFIQQDTTNFFIMLPTLLMSVQVDLTTQSDSRPFFCASFVCALALGSFGTNLFHKWAHASRVPRGVRWLQRHGLILSPGRHRVHHADHSRAFCVTSGWMNPVLDAVSAFARLEAAVRSLPCWPRP